MPNAGTVEAKCKAEWPLQGQATEGECRPDRSPQTVLHKHNTNVLKGAGTCKPEGELVILKNAALT